MIKKLSSFFLALFILALPFSTSVLLWQNPFLQGENFNPYTNFSLYISEVALLLSAIFFLIKNLSESEFKIKKSTFFITLGILGFSVLSILFAQDKISASLGLIHVFALMIALLLFEQNILSKSTLKRLFVATVIVQALIGIAQVVLQHSIGLAFLGEPLIAPTVAGVAKINLFGHTWIRAYGTFPHANILAGYLLMGLFFVAQECKGKIRILLMGLLGIALILAGSKAALLCLFAALAFTKIIKPKVSVMIASALGILLLLKIPDLLASESVHERLEYLKISLSMFLHRPWGVGLHQFTARMQEFTTAKLQPWQFQPVHNIYALVTNELGILGGGALILGFWVILKKNSAQKLRQTRSALQTRSGAKCPFPPLHFSQRSEVSLHPLPAKCPISHSDPKKIFFVALLTFALLGLFDHYLWSLYPGIMLWGMLAQLTAPQPNQTL